jgi:citrate lyase subunit beta/citryl-CoA lyase
MVSQGIGVRISRASPEADLVAAVWPGVSEIYCPRAESAEYIRQAADEIGRLERQRGIRPGTVEVRPLIESAKGVTMAREIAASSARIHTFGVGPNLELALGGDALSYARDECEFHARALGLDPHDLQHVLD